MGRRSKMGFRKMKMNKADHKRLASFVYCLTLSRLNGKKFGMFATESEKRATMAGPEFMAVDSFTAFLRKKDKVCLQLFTAATMRLMVGVDQFKKLGDMIIKNGVSKKFPHGITQYMQD